MRPSSRSFLPRLVLSLVPALAAAASTGCADEGPGSLIIPVQLGNNKACDDVGVVELRATLSSGGEDIEEETDCSAGEIRVDDVPAGTYDLLVQGIADDGVAIVDNLGGDILEARVIGDGATRTLDTVRLTDAPARLRVAWDFNFSSCADAGIDEFEITAYAAGTGTNELLTSSIDCDAAADEGMFHLVPDPDREIDGDVVGEAGVVPRDSSGNSVGTSVAFEFDPPGPGHNVDLVLQCDGSGCDAA